MKSHEKRAIQTSKAASARQLSENNRDTAFRRIRDAERKAGAEKTARLRKLRLEKEAAEHVANEPAPTERAKTD